ncbi:MAG: polyribonucleotide nucleotidyltransferase [Armatimonadetes bacterium]|nr:polyribonucleotide nucleotidyltransferase [Armatimonadota bacterium]
MSHFVEREIAGRRYKLETGKIGKQAGGSVWLQAGDTVVIANATMSSNVREGMDFFPLTCDYEERKYAVGKIPGGFMKRGGRPSEKGILTSRLIDRPVRPLFPDGMRNDVQVIAMPLSVDPDNLPDTNAIFAASAALTVSNIPWDGPVGAVRIGRVNGELVVNPSVSQLAESDLDLVVAGTEKAIIMVEAGANFVTETDILAAMDTAHAIIKEQCSLQLELHALAGKPKTEVALFQPDSEILATIQSEMGEEIRASIQNPDKAARESALDDLKKDIVARLLERFEGRKAAIAEAAEKSIKKAIRYLIIEDGVRPDGRNLEQIRPITSEVGLLPRVHGSGLFTRGQTQVLTVATLGTVGDAQVVDSLEEDTVKRYMHFYNFPPYSVGEVRPLRGAGRREIGHGALAERALIPVLPALDSFPYTLLLQSEVLESNGSTSMASVCGSSLALMDAGVPISAPVAGIAMGLMTLGDKFAVLSDIQGMEDFSGDMDFKVAGTAEGITAIQMDTKIQGIPREVMVQALEQARQGRLHILGKLNEAITASRPELSQYAPSIITIEINPERIGELIGPGGKTIKRISAETGAQIDIQQDGKVFVAAVNQEAGRAAVDIIQSIVGEIEIGSVFAGKVTRLLGIGAFVEFAPGREGLVHISQLRVPTPRRPDDVVSVGDEIKVKVFEVDGQGRINLTALNLDNSFAPGIVEAPPSGGGGRPSGGGGGRDRDRGGDRDRDRDRGGDRDRDRDRGGRGGTAPSGGQGGPGIQSTPAPAPEPEPEEDEAPKFRFRPRR